MALDLFYTEWRSLWRRSPVLALAVAVLLPAVLWGTLIAGAVRDALSRR